MELIVYKGFSISFLEKLDLNEALVVGKLLDKVNVLSFNKEIKKKLDISLKSLDQNDSKWVTYEEYTLIKDSVSLSIEDDDYQLKVTVINNNLFADVFPIPFKIDEKTYIEIKQSEDSIDKKTNLSKEAKKISNIYSQIFFVDNKYYGTFYNYEYDKSRNINFVSFYKKQNIKTKGNKEKVDLSIYINDDLESYLKTINEIILKKPKTINIKDAGTRLSKRMVNSICAYCKENSIQIVSYHEKLKDDNDSFIKNELVDIAKNTLKIPEFKEFRKIKFYKNPDIDNEIIEISQDRIIKEIITQAENSYKKETHYTFRDIFLTAFTGAGKSVLFQIPAVYLAKKYKKLTIIIEPVIALMEDQKNALHARGYDRVECFNSNLITQVDRENVLKKIKNGQIDLLYLSPETLLSYSLETIIGDRELGLLIVDEAHIVTTWGYGFRPDYWYLGGYINKIRNLTWSRQKNKRRIQHFPICAFTATAINGGKDDSVNETVISLYMENPIRYIGLMKRNDISFNIKIKEKNKLSTDDYRTMKADDLINNVHQWITNNEKSIVYFPFASIANEAYRGRKYFIDANFDLNFIGCYTGKNKENLNIEVFKNEKNEDAEKFKNGIKRVMFATKAFGMGVDINDIKNVYHYAATGNLCDYVQEIGRAARKNDMKGYAITDFYENDLTYMNTLFGMSQIRNYQIDIVLSNLYNTYKNKNERNFLISPESFAYIFASNYSSENSSKEKIQSSINKLKTCLLLLEKDFYDKYNFKVLISRPQSVFTKSYVCIKKDYENTVLNSKYGRSFVKVTKGRKDYRRIFDDIDDQGDIYLVDLKEIWENYYSNISFPQFKFFYYSYKTYSKEDKIDVLPEIQPFIFTRQKITIKAKYNRTFGEIYKSIMLDLSEINNILYANFRNNGNEYFTVEEFAKAINKKFGKKSSIIANTIFGLVSSSNSRAIKFRHLNDKTEYFIPNGLFSVYLSKALQYSFLFETFKNSTLSECSHFISTDPNFYNEFALKILSIFDYISYEIAGGEQPEIFIRLNSPSLIENIVTGKVKYQNDYVKLAFEKHDRDVKILYKFFTELKNDKDRWDYIERYFLGQNVIE